MDTFTREKRSSIMSCVKSKNNKSTEILLLSLFRQHFIHGWRRNFNLVGHPDFVFPKYHIAIFVDGCFWHSCKKHLRLPKTNKVYWSKKLLHNKKRDTFIAIELKKLGWKIIRIWEHELKNDTLPYRLHTLIKES